MKRRRGGGRPLARRVGKRFSSVGPDAVARGAHTIPTYCSLYTGPSRPVRTTSCSLPAIRDDDRMFVFAHLSDVHLDLGSRALERTRRVMDYLRGLPIDAILVTGDIADHGAAAE